MSGIAENIKQFISRQWRGEHPALLTIFVLLLGMRLLIGLIPFIDNKPVSWLVVGASLAVLIWQLVGTWRCIERSLKFGDMAIYWGGCAALGIAMVMALLHTTDLLIGPPPKITPESLRTKPLPSLSEDGSTVYLKGEFDFDLNSDLLTLIKQNKGITTVELESNGGLIYAARALAFSIEKNQLNTHVESECNSACTVAYMAGKKRTLGKNGKIGFHQYELQKPHPLQVEQTDDEQETDRKFFERRGVAKTFLEQVYQSNHQDIWQPEKTELSAAGVITSN